MFNTLKNNLVSYYCNCITVYTVYTIYVYAIYYFYIKKYITIKKFYLANWIVFDISWHFKIAL